MRLARFIRLLAVLFLVGALTGLPLVSMEVQARGAAVFMVAGASAAIMAAAVITVASAEAVSGPRADTRRGTSLADTLSRGLIVHTRISPTTTPTSTMSTSTAM